MSAEAPSISRQRSYSLAQKRAILQRFADSGMGVADFCRQEGIAKSSFHHWRHRLSGEYAAPSLPKRSSPGFVDVGPLADTAPGPCTEIRLELGAGIVLYLVRR